MTHFTRFLFLGLSGLILASATGQSVKSADNTLSLFQARRLKTGYFQYQDLKDDKPVGTGRIAIHRIAGSANYRFSAEIKFGTASAGYQSQRWQSVAAADFSPVSATLRFGQTTNATPIFELNYLMGRVTGFAVDRAKGAEKSRRLIDETVPADVVDQRIDWAAVLAGPLEAGKHFQFHVYDPVTGVSPVNVEVGSSEQVRVPAGSFAAYRVVYRIDKAGAKEEYQVLASRDQPRFMVREDFPNGVASVLAAINGKGSPPDE